jgi:hypothetical protein
MENCGLELIETIGTGETAEILGIKQPSVSGWKSRKRIPADKLIRLAVIAEKRGICTRRDIFPDTYADIWPELAEGKDEK